MWWSTCCSRSSGSGAATTSRTTARRSGSKGCKLRPAASPTVDALYIGVHEAPRRRIVSPYGRDMDTVLVVPPAPMDLGLAGHVITTGQPLVIGDLSDPAQRPAFLVGMSFGAGETRTWIG